MMGGEKQGLKLKPNTCRAAYWLFFPTFRRPYIPIALPHCNALG
jgi:hypothetical protein